MNELQDLIESLKEYEKIYIYGAGNYGKFALTYLNDNGLSEKVASFLVSTRGGGGILTLFPIKM